MAIIIYTAHCTLNMHNDNSFDCYILVFSILFIFYLFFSHSVLFHPFSVLFPLYHSFSPAKFAVLFIRCFAIFWWYSVFSCGLFVCPIYEFCVFSDVRLFSVLNIVAVVVITMEYECGILLVQQSYSNF